MISLFNEVRFLKKIEEEFGNNAGKVWQAINTHGNIDETNLKKITKLDERKFYSAIGWLARENKICKVGKYYRLGETNLTDRIGTNAGKIWGTLNSNNDIDISSITKITRIQENDAYLAIGWLARESKIEFQKKNKEKQLFYKLK